MNKISLLNKLCMIMCIGIASWTTLPLNPTLTLTLIPTPTLTLTINLTLILLNKRTFLKFGLENCKISQRFEEPSDYRDVPRKCVNQQLIVMSLHYVQDCATLNGTSIKRKSISGVARFLLPAVQDKKIYPIV